MNYLKLNLNSKDCSRKFLWFSNLSNFGLSNDSSYRNTKSDEPFIGFQDAISSILTLFQINKVIRGCLSTSFVYNEKRFDDFIPYHPWFSYFYWFLIPVLPPSGIIFSSEASKLISTWWRMTIDPNKNDHDPYLK